MVHRGFTVYAEELSSWENTMDVGIFTWFGYVQPLRDSLQMIAQAGFERVMLWWGDSLAAYYGTPKETADWVREAGLTVDSIHVPYENVTWLWDVDAGFRKKAFAALESFAEDCRCYGFPRLVVHVSQRGEMPPRRPETREGFRRLAEDTQRLGVQVALENTDQNAYLRYILDDPDCAALRFCLDTSHAALTGEREALLQDYGRRLACLHLSDNRGHRDDHFLPGQGNLSWDGICADLHAADYRGCLSLEVLPTPEQQAALSAQEFLREAFASAEILRRRMLELCAGPAARTESAWDG